VKTGDDLNIGTIIGGSRLFVLVLTGIEKEMPTMSLRICDCF
jgi:hypothetical protein